MVIDVHTHLFPDDIVRDRGPWLDDRQFALLYDDPRSQLVDTRGMIDYMKRDAVDRVVALAYPWTRSEYCRHHNDYMAKIDRSTGIIPFGSVPIDLSINVEEAVASIASLGLGGIGEVAFYEKGFTEAEVPFLDRLLASAVEHHLPVNLHVNEPIGHRYPGKYLPRFDLLFPLLQKHPEAVIIFAHWGGGLPFYELMPEVGQASANWYYDTATSPFLYDASIFPKLACLVGADKILLGTDFPLLGMKRYYSAMEALNSDDRKKIEGSTARAIFGV